jgi:hypothetical protein
VVPRREEPADDAFLWDQGPASGLSAIRFADPGPVFAAWPQPNVAIFRQQLELFKALLATAPPTEAQQKDIDFLLTVGELFTLVVYAQLILENAGLRGAEGIDGDTVDTIFDVLVRDFSRHAVDLHGKAASTEQQMGLALQMIRKPAQDPARRDRIWRRIHALKEGYEMAR